MEKNKKNIGKVEHFSEEDLRFATPVEIANYRAERLKCNIIVDLCSGIGIQSEAFSKTCKEVFAFELDERKVEFAKKNFENSKNITFEFGDVLDEHIIERVRELSPDIIFCDPERLPSEKERNLDSIKPNLKKLLEVYSKITPNICLEIPPQIELGKLNELGECEKEYLSFKNKLNRLDLYFGKLKKSEISVVDAVSNEKIERASSLNKFEENSKNAAKAVKTTDKLSKYIYEPSTAIIKAELESEFAKKISGNILECSEKNKILVTSDSLNASFNNLSKPYKVIATANNFAELIFALKKSRLGKVVLKYAVDPKDYWKERNSIENNLSGNKEATLFSLNHKGKRELVICEKII